MTKPNNRINSDWQFRCAPLPAGYAERYRENKMTTKDDKESAERMAKEILQKCDEDLLRDIFYQYNIAYSKNDSLQINRTIAYFSVLLIKLSRQAEKSTNKIILVTWALLGVTVALLIVALVQIVIFK